MLDIGRNWERVSKQFSRMGEGTESIRWRISGGNK